MAFCRVQEAGLHKGRNEEAREWSSAASWAGLDWSRLGIENWTGGGGGAVFMPCVEEFEYISFLASTYAAI